MNCPSCGKFWNRVACESCGYTEGESIPGKPIGVKPEPDWVTVGSGVLDAEPAPGVPEIDSGEGPPPEPTSEGTPKGGARAPTSPTDQNMEGGPPGNEAPPTFEEAVAIVLESLSERTESQSERLEAIEAAVRQMGGKLVSTGQNIGRLQTRTATPAPKSFMQELADAPPWVKEAVGTVTRAISGYLGGGDTGSMFSAELAKQVVAKEQDYIKGRVGKVLDGIYSQSDILVRDEE